MWFSITYTDKLATRRNSRQDGKRGSGNFDKITSIEYMVDVDIERLFLYYSSTKEQSSSHKSQLQKRLKPVPLEIIRDEVISSTTAEIEKKFGAGAMFSEGALPSIFRPFQLAPIF